LEAPDVPFEMQRLATWCQGLNTLDQKQKYYYLFVDQETFAKYHNDHAGFRKFVDFFYNFY
jgi:hypothetical protein